MQNEVNTRRALRIFEHLAAHPSASSGKELRVSVLAVRDVLRWMVDEPNAFGDYLEEGEAILERILAAEAKAKARINAAQAN